jgi:hypothetical protein
METAVFEIVSLAMSRVTARGFSHPARVKASSIRRRQLPADMLAGKLHQAIGRKPLPPRLRNRASPVLRDGD